jgi:hypothetical protein
VNDSQAVSSLLKEASFDVVDSRSDLGVIEMRRALREFSNTTRNVDIAVIFFAGHGIEIDGVNYLIPVDAKLNSDFDVEDEALSLERVLRTIDSAKRLRLVIVDACRNNPFVASMKRTVANRSVGRGLARVEPATSDTLIAFAAKAGSTAEDGDGPHSPFTAAFLKHFAIPGLDVRIAFGRIRDEVMVNTRNYQEPQVYGSLGGETISVVPAAPEPKVVGSLRQPAPDAKTEIRRDYELAAQVGTKEAWDSFLAQNDIGFYADLARAQRDKIVRSEGAAKPIQASEGQAGKSAGLEVTAVSGPPPEGHDSKHSDSPAGLLQSLSSAIDSNDKTRELSFWNNIKESNDPNLFEDYLRRYPDGVFSRLAKLTLESIRSTTSNKPADPDDKIQISDPNILKEIRDRLYELNFDPGSGDDGTQDLTRRAIREFQAKNSLAQTGWATPALLRHLREVDLPKPWGSIVYAKDAQKWGMSWGNETRRAAVASAHASCHAQCMVEVSFVGTECAAFARSRGGWAIVARDNIQRARDSALDECQRKSKACRIIASVCADGTQRFSATE